MGLAMAGTRESARADVSFSLDLFDFWHQCGMHCPSLKEIFKAHMPWNMVSLLPMDGGVNRACRGVTQTQTGSASYLYDAQRML